ncbi:MAG: hypothetical protein L3J24_10000 [Xanthomonadales bacterium]|nr:hypothetical protein [Xanthomonadales bacterium]
MSTLTNRKSTKKLETSTFSEFIRNASSAEKKRVYARVLEKASLRQQQIIKEAKESGC